MIYNKKLKRDTPKAARPLAWRYTAVRECVLTALEGALNLTATTVVGTFI